MSVERMERLADEVRALLDELLMLAVNERLAKEQEEKESSRQYWVFRHRCGCAYGVLDAKPDDVGINTVDRAAAWAEFYEDEPATGFESMMRGDSLILCDHQHYVLHYSRHLEASYRCPHGLGD